jgi:hypothetical protein
MVAYNPNTQEAEADKDYQLKTSLGYTARPCLKKQKEKNKILIMIFFFIFY